MLMKIKLSNKSAWSEAKGQIGSLIRNQLNGSGVEEPGFSFVGLYNSVVVPNGSNLWKIQFLFAFTSNS